MRDARSGHTAETVVPQSNAPGRPEAHGRGKRPRPPSVPTSTTCNTAASPARGRERLPCRRASGRQRAGRGSRHRRKCTRPPASAAPARAPKRVPSAERAAQAARLNSPGRTLRIHPFASVRFHVLLNSLFKVLFNFPSRYLSAIGLVPVFSLRWSLPPALGCIPKQPDSKEAR